MVAVFTSSSFLLLPIPSHLFHKHPATSPSIFTSARCFQCRALSHTVYGVTSNLARTPTHPARAHSTGSPKSRLESFSSISNNLMKYAQEFFFLLLLFFFSFCWRFLVWCEIKGPVIFPAKGEVSTFVLWLKIRHKLCCASTWRWCRCGFMRQHVRNMRWKERRYTGRDCLPSLHWRRRCRGEERQGGERKEGLKLSDNSAENIFYLFPGRSECSFSLILTLSLSLLFSRAQEQEQASVSATLFHISSKTNNSSCLMTTYWFGFILKTVTSSPLSY